MGHPSLVSIVFLAYAAAASAFLLVTVFVLCWVVRAAGRSGSGGWALAGQELVWTLIPALVLIALTVAGEFPRGWHMAIADLTGESTEIASPDVDRATVQPDQAAEILVDGPRSRR